MREREAHLARSGYPTSRACTGSSHQGLALRLGANPVGILHHATGNMVVWGYPAHISRFKICFYRMEKKTRNPYKRVRNFPDTFQEKQATRGTISKYTVTCMQCSNTTQTNTYDTAVSTTQHPCVQCNGTQLECSASLCFEVRCPHCPMVEQFEDGDDAMYMASFPCPQCKQNDLCSHIEDQPCSISWPCTGCDASSAFTMTLEEYNNLLERDPEQKEMEEKVCIHCGQRNGKGFRKV